MARKHRDSTPWPSDRFAIVSTCANILRVRLSRTEESKDTIKPSDLISCVQKWPMGKLCRGVSDY